MGIREFTPTQQQKNNQTLNIRKAAERSGRRRSSRREEENREGDERICWMASSQNVLEFKKIKNKKKSSSTTTRVGMLASRDLLGREGLIGPRLVPCEDLERRHFSCRVQRRSKKAWQRPAAATGGTKSKKKSEMVKSISTNAQYVALHEESWMRFMDSIQ